MEKRGKNRPASNAGDRLSCEGWPASGGLATATYRARATTSPFSCGSGGSAPLPASVMNSSGKRTRSTPPEGRSSPTVTHTHSAVHSSLHLSSLPDRQRCKGAAVRPPERVARTSAKFGQKWPIASAQPNFGSDFLKPPRWKVAVAYQKD